MMSSNFPERYSRQMVMPAIGAEGQAKLQKAKVLVLGAGGLGSPAALYLAAAGVGTLGLLDKDSVELSNLNRQILHQTKDLGRPKVESGREKLSALNPETTIETHAVRLDAANAEALFARYDLVVCCPDNFEARYVTNQVCVRLGKPWVYAAVSGWEGQLFTVLPGRGPCYRCVFPEPPAPQDELMPARAGILGAVAGVFGALQAAEAVKWIVGEHQGLSFERLFLADLRQMVFRTRPIKRRPDCCDCQGKAH